MKPTESASSAQVLKKTQPEQYDLVILGDGTGSTLAAWTFAPTESVSPSSSENSSADRARTSRAFRARTSSIARRSRRTFAERNGRNRQAGFGD
jgi:hypothetical protein